MEKHMFIQTIPEAEADGKLLEIYDGDRKSMGYVPNHAKVFSLRPDVLEAWRTFQGSIRKNLRLWSYELVTIAAAQELKCRYCLLAHGSVLIRNGLSIDQLRAILFNFREAGLDSREVAMMEYAQKVIRNANRMTQADINLLRSFGFEDVEILDITLTATMRSFASKTFDALGAPADKVYRELEALLVDLLPV